jgi:hypothetical protein
VYDSIKLGIHAIIPIGKLLTIELTEHTRQILTVPSSKNPNGAVMPPYPSNGNPVHQCFHLEPERAEQVVTMSVSTAISCAVVIAAVFIELLVLCWASFGIGQGCLMTILLKIPPENRSEEVVRIAYYRLNRKCYMKEFEEVREFGERIEIEEKAGNCDREKVSIIGGH